MIPFIGLAAHPERLCAEIESFISIGDGARGEKSRWSLRE